MAKKYFHILSHPAWVPVAVSGAAVPRPLGRLTDGRAQRVHLVAHFARVCTKDTNVMRIEGSTTGFVHVACIKRPFCKKNGQNMLTNVLL